jgi:hypothetical protein
VLQNLLKRKASEITSFPVFAFLFLINIYKTYIFALHQQSAFHGLFGNGLPGNHDGVERALSPSYSSEFKFLL